MVTITFFVVGDGENCTSVHCEVHKRNIRKVVSNSYQLDKPKSGSLLTKNSPRLRGD